MLLVRYGGAFFLTNLFVAVGLLVAIDTPLNEAIVGSAKWAFLPILILSIAFTRQYIDRIRILSRRSIANIWSYTFLTAGTLTFFSWPYALLFNATFGESEAVELGGFVESKSKSGGRSPSFLLVTRPERLKQTVRLQVRESIYDATQVGEQYAECFLVGPLGFFYRWRYTDEPINCHATRNAP